MKKILSKVRGSKLFNEFFENEKSSGLVLIACTIFSLLMANSIFQSQYHHTWLTDIGGKSLEYWINDGLMTIFFLLIGLELEREIYIGELSKIKDALLPIFAALGGMLVPAGIYLVINYGLDTQSGSGIPMATDIAFALGVLSLLGNRVPLSLKIFLTALAVIDDLGAILVIAAFYTKTIFWINLLSALGVLGILFVLNRMKVKALYPYLIGGVIMWFFMLNSGIHATITGVVLAFVIPFQNGEKNSISYKLQHFLHKPVAFFILPLFALSNTAIGLNGNIGETLAQPYSIGILLGLIFGKPIGITLVGYLSTQFNFTELPKGLQWSHIFGMGLVAGIGFTVALFIANLSFTGEVLTTAKLSIILASLSAGILGVGVNLYLHRSKL